MLFASNAQLHFLRCMKHIPCNQASWLLVYNLDGEAELNFGIPSAWFMARNCEMDVLMCGYGS